MSEAETMLRAKVDALSARMAVALQPVYEAQFQVGSSNRTDWDALFGIALDRLKEGLPPQTLSEIMASVLPDPKPVGLECLLGDGL